MYTHNQIAICLRDSLMKLKQCRVLSSEHLWPATTGIYTHKLEGGTSSSNEKVGTIRLPYNNSNINNNIDLSTDIIPIKIIWVTCNRNRPRTDILHALSIAKLASRLWKAPFLFAWAEIWQWSAIEAIYSKGGWTVFSCAVILHTCLNLWINAWPSC